MTTGLLGVLGRIAAMSCTVLVGAVLVFLTMKTAPGDPALTVLGENARPEAIAHFRALHHLDEPIARQLITWLTSALIGDFGKSLTIAGGLPVASLVWQRLGTTAFLGIYALALAICLSLGIGILAALHRARLLDTLSTSLLVVGVSVPDFWLSYLLILFLALGAGWFPAYGFVALTDSFIGALSSGFLPALAIALPMAAVFARTLRSALLEVAHRDYVTVARSFGFSKRFIFQHFILRNALIPYVTVVGLQVRYLLGGVVVVERIFGVPGLGSLLADGALGRDYTVVQACAVMFLVIVLIVNLLVDILCKSLDPRRSQ